jgi:hypothetical protein
VSVINFIIAWDLFACVFFIEPLMICLSEKFLLIWSLGKASINFTVAVYYPWHLGTMLSSGWFNLSSQHILHDTVRLFHIIILQHKNFSMKLFGVRDVKFYFLIAIN